MPKTIYTDATYLNNNPSWHVEDSAWKARQVLRMLERHNLQPRTICEVGCGAGEILAQLRDATTEEVQLSGYEISPQAFELCRRREGRRLTFFLKNFLEESGRSFDLLLLMDVIEHVEDCYGFLRSLRPRAGYTILHIPLDISVQTVLRGGFFQAVHTSAGHLHYFTKETALQALEDAGYHVLDHIYTAGAVDLPARSWKMALARLPRKIAFAAHPDFAVRLLGGYSLLVLAGRDNS
jgi:cyclopropane fatty-acyl-phospholipid synthase-like methyltransferase